MPATAKRRSRKRAKPKPKPWIILRIDRRRSGRAVWAVHKLECHKRTLHARWALPFSTQRQAERHARGLATAEPLILFAVAKASALELAKPRPCLAAFEEQLAFDFAAREESLDACRADPIEAILCPGCRRFNLCPRDSLGRKCRHCRETLGSHDARA